MIPVAILAGGLATRLRPITTTIPKALAEVAGHPFIHWQLQDLAVQGAHDVVMLVGYLGEQIEKEIGNGHQYGLNIRYVFDGPTLLGTGGALRQALPLLGDAFFVLYGDSFLQVNYQAVEAAFIKSGQRALMTVLKNGNQWDKSNATFSGGQLIEYNKKSPTPAMTYIDYGLSILTRQALEDWHENGVFDLASLFHYLSVSGQLAGFEVFERFYEIGTPQSLAEANAYFSSKRKP